MNHRMSTASNHSSSYRQVQNGLLRMHELFLAGMQNSSDAEAVRDATDEPWNELSDDERENIQGLSQDLYEVEGVDSKTTIHLSPLELEQKVVDAIKARDDGQLERALAILRQCNSYKPASKISYIRGTIWSKKNESKTAALFFQHAVSQEPTDEYLRLAWLSSLKTANPDEAVVEADKILNQYKQFAPPVVIFACEIIFSSTAKLNDIDCLPEYKRLIPILQAALQNAKDRQPPYPLSIFGMGLGLLASCNEHLRDADAAFNYFSEAIKLDPTNSALLTARAASLDMENTLPPLPILKMQ
jgi:tetratricopeptide (TPR) repeat protein